MPQGDFKFDGSGLSYLWLVIWTGALTLLTAGLAYPWAFAAKERWHAKNTTINGKQLVFKGSGMGFFGNWLLIMFLSLITLGIYAPWGHCRIERWKTNNQYFAQTGDIEEI